MKQRTELKTALGAALALNFGQLAISAGEKGMDDKSKASLDTVTGTESYYAFSEAYHVE